MVGGVSPPTDAPATITLDLRQLDRVLEVDRSSRAARIQAGVSAPRWKPAEAAWADAAAFPAELRILDLGGWIATRSGGHFATLYTHIDDFVESLRVVTPRGVLETRRLPGSGAGPSPDRMFIGSEGILGVITEAWMRLQDRPRFRAGGAVRFKDFFAAARALRVLTRPGFIPPIAASSIPRRPTTPAPATARVAIMVLAFESADHPLDAWMARALECCADHGGMPEVADRADAHREGAAGLWRNAFIRMPYAREKMTPRGIISDTFETAITWDRFEAFHDQMKAAAERRSGTRLAGRDR